ncbi:uncharacterized protein H6S33_001297 [Morchella sextelata]|uniref:uncharacterized protein n=1 Tax=Morchella sextelata TaxID=1174677 RepID=UPI001D057596|nr:uncharacterized protein H6S33_001297 [Morchella sextelata]KAH0609069.1 hypothetical protein H6S33_001297 [Morchella sextelata]
MAAANTTTAAAKKVILAPMVRTGELPTRLLSLKRVINKRTGTIDFVKPSGGARGEEKVVFRTHPEIEGGKVVFQMGTANAELAVEAAKVLVSRGEDGEREGGTVVAGVDVNSGCPKHFSIHAGMGAGLLKNPDNLVAILTSLVTQIGIPHSLPISVKIRLLEPHSETLKLVERLCTTGIYRLTLHCRTIPQRPRDPAIRDVLADVANICHAAGVECIANGDVLSRSHALQLCDEYGVDGCMIARAAEVNMSVFLPDKPLPWKEIADEFVKTAVKIESHFTNTKFVLGRIIPGKDPIYQKVHQAKTHEQICGILGIPYEPLSPTIVEEMPVEGKAATKAVEKAKSVSATARAAGGVVAPRKEGRKLAERGVGSAANIKAAAEREAETATVTIPEQAPVSA